MTTPSLPRFPGRDRRAVLHRATPGLPATEQPRRVVVVGGGIAGLAAAAGLAERGVDVVLLEKQDQLGGRVRSWPVGDDRTMSRGFHAFFRQYYTLRALLRRADPTLAALAPCPDYPLQRRGGVRDSFARIPATPPWSVLGFVATSPSFPLSALPSVDVPSAMELVNRRFPQDFSHYDGESAQAFLDRLHFPHEARHLALEVFARSFFAHPEDFSAGELVAMFHTYFTGSAEGLLFDLPVDDYDACLWAPLGEYLRGLGVDIRTGVEVTRVGLHGKGVRVDDIEADAVVLAADPRATRSLVLSGEGFDEVWRAQVTAGRNAPPFAVWRLWLDRPVAPEREAFLGTSGYRVLDNVTVLERFEAGARRWADENGGSVIELHAYAVDPQRDPSLADPAVLRELLRADLDEVYPETRGAGVLHEELLVEDDCGLVPTTPWADRAGVRTPHPQVVLAGDGVRCSAPVALMERAAVTGFLAANALLEGWGVAGHDLWTVPMTGLAAGLRR